MFYLYFLNYQKKHQKDVKFRHQELPFHAMYVENKAFSSAYLHKTLF